MITMFILLTLENLPAYLETGQELSDWTIAFYVSYILLAAFLIFNLFIGIVINSMDEARKIEMTRQERELIASGDIDDAHKIALIERVRDLKKVVEEIERELAADRRRPGG